MSRPTIMLCARSHHVATSGMPRHVFEKLPVHFLVLHHEPEVMQAFGQGIEGFGRRSGADGYSWYSSCRFLCN